MYTCGTNIDHGIVHDKRKLLNVVNEKQITRFYIMFYTSVVCVHRCYAQFHPCNFGVCIAYTIMDAQCCML